MSFYLLFWSWYFGNIELNWLFCLACSANTTWPKQTEALEERRLQILSLHYGMRSLRFLLEEQKLKDCGLLGEAESTDDWDRKYVDWKDVPVPESHVSPVDEPLVLGSPIKTLERNRSEHEGILDRMYNMYSPTLLDIRPNCLVYFPRNPDHSFYIWGNPDYIVHRNDAGLKSWQIMYSYYEITEEYLDQYGTNMYKDLSNLTSSIDELPLAILEAEPDLNPYQQSEPESNSTSRLLSSS